MSTSWEQWNEGNKINSWKLTFSARISYLASTITNLVLLPFAIIGIIFGSLHALVTWNRKSTHYQFSKTYIMQKANHFFISVGGCFISPALAYKYKDANLTPYIIAFRITIITSSIIYYAFF